MTSGFSALQVRILAIFGRLPESEGFLLAGGGGLLANGLSERPTTDLDFFHVERAMDGAAAALEEATRADGLTASRIRTHDGFIRTSMTDGHETVIVDLCFDSPPVRPPVSTAIVHTFAPIELAGRKLLALYSRAAARDFIDVHVLLGQFSADEVLAVATEIDAGLDLGVLASMLRTVRRFSDQELDGPGASADLIRRTAVSWAARLDEMPPPS